MHAQNGRRALDLARTIDFDLVMLDGRMPVMDGAATATALRQLEGRMSRVPIIAVTGGDAEEAQACLDAGADTVLRKPVTVGAVARAVADAGGPSKPRKASRKAVA